jgi:DNA-binding transcriptional ArsR family regulator
MQHAPSTNRQTLEKIASIFRSLAEPTRLAILRELKDRERTVNELAEAIGTSQPNVSKQLRLLFDAGFLGREERGISVRYRVEGDLFVRLCDLVCERLNQQAREAVPHYSV